MSAFGGKADIFFVRKADIELAPITVFIGGKSVSHAVRQCKPPAAGAIAYYDRRLRRPHH